MRKESGWNAGAAFGNEDDRARQKVSFTSRQNDVIEISSDEDDSAASGAKPWTNRAGSGSKHPVTPAKKAGRSTYMRSRVVESSDEDDHEDLKSSSISVTVTKTSLVREVKSTPEKPSTTTSVLSKQITAEIYNYGRRRGRWLYTRLSARKPLPKSRLPGSSVTSSVPSTPSLASRISAIPDHLKEASATPSSSTASATPKKRGAGTPRTSKKKAREEEQARLREEADSLFKELNRTIFKGGLPEETKLNWNKRLLTTAGRAKWHRSREGVQTSEIELAEKILTSSERIRNTLSHEMCHLASWVIDKEVKEGHGKFWKAWTRKVMSKYPDIDISTRHDYEIEYPYQWKCASCGKIYGRFSKSIKPDECVCGACRVGRLVPQFQTATRAPTTPRMSRMAAAKPQESPYRSPLKAPASVQAKKSEIVYISSDSEDDSISYIGSKTRTCCIDDTDSEDEVEILAMTFHQSASLSSV
ncbi:SprT-like family-domain-containing protein [Coprinopsis sp. MPI-PUGE-AT-0042]|nr:SprT-like family-domain-containing protein [Coprinopsis sp. MPI-PUGE-AT-0042]